MGAPENTTPTVDAFAAGLAAATPGPEVEAASGADVSTPEPAPAAPAVTASSADPLVDAAQRQAPLAELAKAAELGPAFVAWCAAHDRGEDPPVILGGQPYHLRRGFPLFEAMCRTWRDVGGMQLELLRVDRCPDTAEKLERIITDSVAVVRMLVGDDVPEAAVDEWLCTWGFAAGEFLGFVNVLLSRWLLRDGLGECYAGLDPTVTVLVADGSTRTYTLRFTARAVARVLPAAKAQHVGYISDAVFYGQLIRACLSYHHAAEVDDTTPVASAKTRALVVALADELGLTGLRRLMHPAPTLHATTAAAQVPNVIGASPAPGTGPNS